MLLTKRKFNGFSANTLKYYAIIAMVIDHIAWNFVDTNSVLGQIMHIIGRTTAPIMCYFIAEGYYYTKNIKKYVMRMLIFALISWIPFLFMESVINVSGGRLIIVWQAVIMQSVIYTFLISLLMLIVVHSEYIAAAPKIILIVMLFIASTIGDWLFIAPIWVLIFDRFRGNFKKQAVIFTAASVILITAVFSVNSKNITDFLFQYAVILALIPLSMYNGTRGGNIENKTISEINKWIFYIFYPLHMLIIGIVRICIR